MFIASRLQQQDKQIAQHTAEGVAPFLSRPNTPAQTATATAESDSASQDVGSTVAGGSSSGDLAAEDLQGESDHEGADLVDLQDEQQQQQQAAEPDFKLLKPLIVLKVSGESCQMRFCSCLCCLLPASTA